MRVLVCGGAGYIGSHMCKMLAEHGHEVGVFDDLSTGHRAALKWGKHFAGDLCDPASLEKAFAEFKPGAVFQFAAKIVVPESVREPALYYRVNVAGSLNLIEQAHRHGNCPIVFSSTAAIFGNPIAPKVDENHPRNPINPYGRSKLMVEHMLADVWAAHGLPSVSFRYFNAAGADASGEIGESHNPETHLIPNVLESLLGKGPGLRVYGNDYDTRDGTCIRDYIHINDLCRAHLLGLELMQRKPGCSAFNLGNGNGFTVREVLDVAASVTGQKVSFEVAPRRAGDAPVLVADSAEAHRSLGWQPAHASLGEIIESAWRWHRARKF